MTYRIDSMTKPITSVELMMLFDEGAFLLESPLARWLPEFVTPKCGPAVLPATSGGHAVDHRPSMRA